VGFRSNLMPVYVSDRIRGAEELGGKKYLTVKDARDEVLVALAHEFRRSSVMKWGLVRAYQRYTPDGVVLIPNPDGPDPVVLFPGIRFRNTAARWQWDIDQLDSLSFPTQGYALGLRLESGLGGDRYRRSRAQIQWARSWGPHVLNLGGQWAQDTIPQNCATCLKPSPLLMGGFQFMGAYRMGQLSGDQLAHAHSTYMYRLTDGGLLRQKSFVGLVAEVGDAWDANTRFQARGSLSLFLAVDSRIGDIYLGAARGSAGVYNLFLQVGRRFQF
jgi:NTE family protein